MSKKRAYIKTFGCQMNVHDSEKMAGILEAAGYEVTDERKGADLIIYNTCSIREKAEQKFMSDLGRLKATKQEKPGLKIAVAGCMAQQMGKELFKRAPHVDYVIGPQNIHSISDMLKDVASDRVAVDDNPDATLLELPASRKEGVKAWVSIMYGCNNFCTYCIVPFTRGRETSRPSANIINEIKHLTASGFKEVTLLGQNVNSYESDIGFVDLLRKINEIDGLKRLRFVTNHPRNLSDELAGAMGELDKACSHIHLPMQSGSDRILKAMNRKYTMAEYMSKIEALRKHQPGISITSDIIAGFPSETEEEHQMTINALKVIEFDGIYAFNYSVRPGTKASDMEGHITEDIKRARLNEILSVQEVITHKSNRALEGQVVEIMLDYDTADKDGNYKGRTDSNKIVVVSGNPAPIDGFAQVRITKGNKHSLLAEPV